MESFDKINGIAAPMPEIKRPQGLRNWVLYTMEDHCGFYEFVEDENGVQWSGAIQNPDGSRPLGTGEILLTDRAIDVEKVTHNLEFYDGSARIKSGNFALTDAEGTLREFELELIASGMTENSSKHLIDRWEKNNVIKLKKNGRYERIG